MKPHTLAGRRFGYLLAIAPTRGQTNKTYWLCACDCGVRRPVQTSSLVSGRTTSCGCVNQGKRLARNFTHRGSSLPEYEVWQGMLARCHSPSSSQFKWYGARGIAVCDRWRADFAAFLADMGRRPSSAYSIERVDNDKGYEPENCCWATRAAQSRNRRNTVVVSIDGECMALTDAAERRGLRYHTVYARLHRGRWQLARALDLAPGTVAEIVKGAALLRRHRR